MDRWTSKPIVCSGGLDLATDSLTLGQTKPGYATALQNYEPSLEGGYERILGFLKYDASIVPGTGPILGVKVGYNGVFAARKNAGSTGVNIYFSTGSGWGSPINTVLQNVNALKYYILSFYFATEVTIFCDGKGRALHYASSTNTLINGVGAPASPQYAEFFAGRLVLAPASNPNSFALSKPNDPKVFDGAQGALEINVGDIITGVKRFRDQLYIFCKNSIWKLIGTSEADFQLLSVTRDIGCLSGWTIVESGGDLIYLAPDGLRSVAGTEKIGDVDLSLVSSAIQPAIRQVTNASFPATAFSAYPVARKSQYRMLVYDTTLTEDSASLGFLGRFAQLDGGGSGYEWALMGGFNGFCADSFAGATGQEIVVHGHPSNGYVYQQETGNSLDGNDIYFLYRSPQLTFDDQTIRKTFQKVKLLTQSKGDFEVTLNLILDHEQPRIQQPNAITLTDTGGGSVYGSAVYGVSLYTGVSFPVFEKNLVGSGFTAALQFAGNDDEAPHRIDSFQISYAVNSRR